MFVWYQGISYGSGILVAVAETVEEARAKVRSGIYDRSYGDGCGNAADAMEVPEGPGIESREPDEVLSIDYALGHYSE